jgi:hypothetical protein
MEALGQIDDVRRRAFQLRQGGLDLLHCKAHILAERHFAQGGAWKLRAPAFAATPGLRQIRREAAPDEH